MATFKDNGKLKLLIIVGTRPEIIRLAAVINECRKYGDVCAAWGGGSEYTIKDSYTTNDQFDYMVKIPDNVAVPEIKEHLSHIDGIADVHHVHIWSMDGQQVCATMHIVTDRTDPALKTQIREELLEHGIVHVTLELERVGEECQNLSCHVAHATSCGHHHHHHH